MQAADHGLGNDATKLLDWSRDRRESMLRATARKTLLQSICQERTLS